MAKRHYSKSEYIPLNKEKYSGKFPIISRRSWERDFMRHCDMLPRVIRWSREPFSIPYRDPITGNATVYVPDFFVVMMEGDKIVQKLIEIKPMQEQLAEHAQSKQDAVIQMKNRAKWGAAIEWCRRHGVEWLVLNESDIYSGHDNRKPTATPIQQYAPGISRPAKKRQPKKAKNPVTEQKKRIRQALKKRTMKIAKARTARSRKAKKA